MQFLMLVHFLVHLVHSTPVSMAKIFWILRMRRNQRLKEIQLLAWQTAAALCWCAEYNEVDIIPCKNFAREAIEIKG